MPDILHDFPIDAPLDEVCCGATCLRVMRRFLEHGETVPYEDRLDG